MNTRSSVREFWVGLVVIVAVAGLIALVGLASDGPGFLAPRRSIDVVFRDGQGIRIGSPVRVAGLDTGNVVDVDLVEVEGTLRARVRMSLPASLVKKLRQDVKVTIVPGLTGMSHVNIVSTGKMAVGLVPGQSITGVESSFFDPIIEQVGLGPVERNHLSHTIAEVRQTVDSIGPRLRQMLGSLQETTTNLRDMSDSIRPAVESTVGHVEDLTKRLSANSPRIEKIIDSGRRPDHAGPVGLGRESSERAGEPGLGARFDRLTQGRGRHRPCQSRAAARRAGRYSHARRPRSLPGRSDC